MSAGQCRNCGSPLRAGIRVCTHCGTPITPSQAVEQIPSPPPTEPIGTTPPGVIRLGSRQVVVLGIVTAVLLIAAIAAGALTASDEIAQPRGQLVAQLPFDEDGGSKSFDGDAGKIKIPKGALDAPTTIDVRRSPLSQRVTAASPTGRTLTFPAGSLVVYTFGPTTLTFNRPVTIVFTLPVDGQSGLIFVTDSGQLRFYTGTVDNGTITIQLNSFDLSQPNAVIRT